jgi:hypothetical protein
VVFGFYPFPSLKILLTLGIVEAFPMVNGTGHLAASLTAWSAERERRCRGWVGGRAMSDIGSMACPSDGVECISWNGLFC